MINRLSRGLGLPLDHEGQDACGDEHRHEYVEDDRVASRLVVDKPRHVRGHGSADLPDGGADADELSQRREAKGFLQYSHLGRNPDAVADAVAKSEGIEHPGSAQE